jgi:hypothetical protein
VSTDKVLIHGTLFPDMPEEISGGRFTSGELELASFWVRNYSSCDVWLRFVDRTSSLCGDIFFKVARCLRFVSANLDYA